MCAATPTLMDLAGSSDGPVVVRSQREHRKPTLLAKVILTGRGKSSRGISDVTAAAADTRFQAARKGRPHAYKQAPHTASCREGPTLASVLARRRLAGRPRLLAEGPASRLPAIDRRMYANPVRSYPFPGPFAV